jgi:hypothetical protein
MVDGLPVVFKCSTVQDQGQTDLDLDLLIKPDQEKEQDTLEDKAGIWLRR